MRRLSVLGLLAVISCQMTTIEDGDSMFRRGNYPQALEIYSNLASEAPSGELDQRLERTRYFMIEQGVRDLLHLDRSEDALEVLDHLEAVAPEDRLPVLASLRSRTLRQIGRRHYDLGFALYEATQIEAAAREYVLCLSWDPANEGARTNLARCEQWLTTRDRIAEDYYFQGMDHLRADQDLRARTAFMHAATLLDDDDSQAAERLKSLTVSLAEESREKSYLYMEAGLAGQAWVAAQDAIYLAPKDPRNQELANHLADLMLSDAYLVAADVARRGGETGAADEFLDKVRELGVVEHSERIRTVSELNQDRKNSDHYARARAYELDNQMVHARDRYQQILDDEGGFGWRDVEQRLTAISARLTDAEQKMTAAQVARGAGDMDGYAKGLQEVLRLSVDFPEAMEQYRAYLAEQE
jgi:tetratricopeptide (TPR) repeat protein